MTSNSPAPVAPPPAAATPTRPARASRWFRWLGLLALAVYAGFLAANMTVVAGGADSSGYMNSAKLFAEGKFRTELRVPPEFAPVPLNRKHFIPPGFDKFPPHDHLAPTYPTGFPLHLALGARLMGWRAGPFVVQLLGALAAVWFIYLAGRELGLGCLLAGAAAVMMAAFPVFIFSSIQTLSDTPATAWAAAALYLALRGRASPGWAAACGAALAAAVLVRPTNVLIAPPLVLILGFNLTRLASFVAGGIPGALWFLAYNHFIFGGALRSGYGDIFAAFGWEYVAPTAAHFGKWLALFLPAVALVLPFAALLRAETRTREWCALVLLPAILIGFYLFCSFSHDAWTYLRYIQPAVPALVLAAVLGVDALARGPLARWARAFRPAAAAVLSLWAIGNSWHAVRTLAILYVPGYELAYAGAADLLKRVAPDNALVLSCNVSGTVYFYTGMPTLVFDSMDPAEFDRYVALARAAGRPIYAALFDIEEEDSLRNRCRGTWTRLGSSGNIGIWRLE